jgi:hypothetical protein
MKKLTKIALITLAVAGFFVAVHAAEERRETVTNLTETYTALGQQDFGEIQLPYDPAMWPF